MKRYVKQNTIYYIADIREQYKNMSIPDDADCSELGYEFLIETTPPKQDGFNAVEIAPLNNVQQWELVAIEAIVPTMLTPRQVRLALLNAGLLDEVEKLLAGSKAMQIWWEYSLDIQRNHEHVVTMASALSLTELQLDELFIEGAKL